MSNPDQDLIDEELKPQKEWYQHSLRQRKLCKEIGLYIDTANSVVVEEIINFLKDEEKVKRAMFILKHPELL